MALHRSQHLEERVLPSLQSLMLNGNEIGDAGVTAMAEVCNVGALPSLQVLALDEERFTDASKQAREVLNARNVSLSFFAPDDSPSDIPYLKTGENIQLATP